MHWQRYDTLNLSIQQLPFIHFPQTGFYLIEQNSQREIKTEGSCETLRTSHFVLDFMQIWLMKFFILQKRPCGGNRSPIGRFKCPMIFRRQLDSFLSHFPSASHSEPWSISSSITLQYSNALPAQQNPIWGGIKWPCMTQSDSLRGLSMLGVTDFMADPL